MCTRWRRRRWQHFRRMSRASAASAPPRSTWPLSPRAGSTACAGELVNILKAWSESPICLWRPDDAYFDSSRTSPRIIVRTASRRGLRLPSSKRARHPCGTAFKTRSTASSREVAAAHSRCSSPSVVTLTKCTPFGSTLKFSSKESFDAGLWILDFRRNTERQHHEARSERARGNLSWFAYSDLTLEILNPARGALRKFANLTRRALTTEPSPIPAVHSPKRAPTRNPSRNREQEVQRANFRSSS